MTDSKHNDNYNEQYEDNFNEECVDINCDVDYDLKIGETMSYQLYNFRYKKEYPTHDGYQQDRWKRAYEYANEFDEGVYRD